MAKFRLTAQELGRDEFKFKPDARDPDNPDDPNCPTNGSRAERAELAITASLQHRGDPPKIDEDAVIDLIADLGHFCDREGLDFTDLVSRGTRHWEVERKG
jgi:hypothetical protein